MSHPRAELRAILWCALFGTLLSIAVATLGARILPQPSERFWAGHSQSREISWLATRYSTGLRRDDTLESALSRPPTLSYTTTEQMHRLDDLASWYFDDGRGCAILESGFPMRSFRGWLVDLSGFSPSFGQSELIKRAGFISPGDDRPGWTGSRFWIPYLPIWPGLLVNALAWSAALWLIACAPRTIRNTLRRKRGQCFKCGYDLNQTPEELPCPECGTRDPHR
jgi:hypothetical protein